MAAAVMMLVAGVAAGPTLSQDESTVPTARQVVDRYVEALGGEEAIRSHNVMAMEGTMEIPGQGVSAEIKIRAMAPNKMKMAMNIPGLGAMQSGFDGEVGWAMNPMTGPMIQEGKELAQAKRQADFYSVFHGDNLYKSMTNTGQVDFEGQACWKVDLVTQEGDSITEYYNIETGLIDAMTQTQETPMGEVTVTTVTSDYKEFGGVMAPTKMTARMGPGMEQSFVITTVTFDGVTEADFALPAEIKALAGGGDTGDVEAPVPAAPQNLDRVD